MKAPRKVLIISLSYFPRYVGGAEVAVKEITDRIPASEAVFDMVTLGDGASPRDETIGNVHVLRVLSSNGLLQRLAYPFVAYRAAKRLQAERSYDMVWSIMASYAGFAAMLLKRKYERLPHLLTIQEGDNFGRRGGAFKPVFRRIFRSADRIQAISSYLAGWSRAMGATCPIDIVPNGVDLRVFSEPVGAAKKAELAKVFGKKDGDTFLVTTSRLVEKNGVGDAISALALLPKACKLLVLGDGKLGPELKQQSLKLGLNYTDEPPVNPGNRVHFLGYVSHADMPPYLAISDVFVRPALTEGLGNSFLEAMAAGIPAIGTPVGGIPDFLTDGETGLFCEPRNPRSIAQKAEKLMRDAESRAYIVERARKLVLERYGWERIAGEMKALIGDMLD